MRTLVTGAAGFIGSHLCRRLVAEGHEVVGLDDLSEGRLENLAGLAELRLDEGDIRDELAVRATIRGCDVVLHHAARKSVERSLEDPLGFDQVNVGGTLTVLLAARDEGASVVFASSSSTYGDQERYPVTEDVAPLTRSPYAATKLAGEAYCRAAWMSYGVPTVALRYFNVYGPRQDPESRYAAVIPRFTIACLTGATPVVFGDGEQSRDFTFIDDVVEANLLAARMPEAALGRALNVGGGAEPTTVNRLLELIADLAGVAPTATHGPPREGDIRRSQADISLARHVIGYDPQVGIEEGLRRTVEWFRAGP